MCAHYTIKGPFCYNSAAVPELAEPAVVSCKSTTPSIPKVPPVLAFSGKPPFCHCLHNSSDQISTPHSCLPQIVHYANQAADSPGVSLLSQQGSSNADAESRCQLVRDNKLIVNNARCLNLLQRFNDGHGDADHAHRLVPCTCMGSFTDYQPTTIMAWHITIHG